MMNTDIAQARALLAAYEIDRQPTDSLHSLLVELQLDAQVAFGHLRRALSVDDYAKLFDFVQDKHLTFALVDLDFCRDALDAYVSKKNPERLVQPCFAHLFRRAQEIGYDFARLKAIVTGFKRMLGRGHNLKHREANILLDAIADGHFNYALPAPDDAIIKQLVKPLH